MVFFVVHAHRFQIFGLENLTTFKAAHVIDTVAPRQHLGLFMVAGLHTCGGYSTILITAVGKSRVLWYRGGANGLNSKRTRAQWLK